jgi:hypothetical protein
LKQWRQYREERAQAHPTSPVAENNDALEQMKRRHQEHRARLHTMLGKHPRCILNLARHLLKLQQRKEIRHLRRKIGKRPRPGRQRFEDWLRDRVRDYQADRWRYRKNLEALPQEFRGTPMVKAVPQREPFASHARHKKAMLKAVPDAETDRLNAYVALQMRTEGFSREVVTDTIFHCAPEDHSDQPERNWRRYAERIAAYAFGIAGDIVLARDAASQEKERQEQQECVEETRQQEAPRLRMR